MKVKLCILTVALLLGTAPAFADTYSIEAFQFSLPQLADWVGENPVGDRADTIAQIGNEPDCIGNFHSPYARLCRRLSNPKNAMVRPG